jgi:hypothetical protein
MGKKVLRITLNVYKVEFKKSIRASENPLEESRPKEKEVSRDWKRGWDMKKGVKTHQRTKAINLRAATNPQGKPGTVRTKFSSGQERDYEQRDNEQRRKTYRETKMIGATSDQRNKC